MTNYLHSTLQVGWSDSQYFKKEPPLSAFPCTVRANLAVVSEEMLKSILCHISNRQPLPTGVPPRPTMRPALPFYLHSGWQPKSSWLSLIGCQRLGIQHPPRRNSLRSSTTKEGLGRSWETVYEPTLHPIIPLCRSVQTPEVCYCKTLLSLNNCASLSTSKPNPKTLQHNLRLLLRLASFFLHLPFLPSKSSSSILSFPTPPVFSSGLAQVPLSP